MHCASAAAADDQSAPASRALFLFPTKALSQDQTLGLTAIEMVAGSPRPGVHVAGSTFVSVTPTSNEVTVAGAVAAPVAVTVVPSACADVARVRPVGPVAGRCPRRPRRA